MRILLILIVVAAIGCSKQTEPPSTEDVIADQPKTDDPHPSKGQSCTIDGQCDTYLRCIAGVCDFPPAITGTKSDTTPSVVFSKEDKEIARFNVELALTSAEMSRGLMHRTEMLDDWGMVFIYNDNGVRSFWMKNTLIPLDMIFVASTGDVVGIVEGAEPLTLDARTVGIPSRYVVEINAGLSSKLGIDDGATMTIENVDEAYRVQP